MTATRSTSPRGAALRRARTWMPTRARWPASRAPPGPAGAAAARGARGAASATRSRAAAARQPVPDPRAGRVAVERRRRPVRRQALETTRSCATVPPPRPRSPARRSSASSGAAGPTLAHPLSSNVRCSGQRHAPGDPALGVHGIERAARLGDSHVVAGAIREVRRRAFEQHLDRRAGQVGAARRARRVDRQPERLPNIEPGQLELVDAAPAAPALLAAYALDPDTKLAQRAPAQLDLVPAAARPRRSAPRRRSQRPSPTR